MGRINIIINTFNCLKNEKVIIVDDVAIYGGCSS